MSEPTISDAEFEALRRMIYKESGIALTEHKRPLLSARLGRRLRALGLSSYEEYLRHLERHDPTGVERRELINAITTNKTEFFREKHHFDFLRSEVLEPLAAQGTQARRRLRIWSAACSTGEEPYSIAMTVADVLRPLEAWDVRILASDIDTDVLARAMAGRYPTEALSRIDPELRQRWCQKSSEGEFQVHPKLQSLIAFRQINFVHSDWPIRTRFDVVFCRNVMIYFDQPTQESIHRRFHALMEPDSFLVAGHSENLRFMAGYFEPIGRTVYRRVGGQTGAKPGPSRAQGTSGGLRGAPAGAGASPAVATSWRSLHGAGQVARQPAGTRRSLPNDNAERMGQGQGRLPRASDGTRVRVSIPRAAEAPRLLEVSPPRAAESGDLPRKRIHSGQLFTSATPAIVSTLLGSCVAACLYDPGALVGGMNHFMLPTGNAASGWNAVCFGTNAMELLINELLGLGARRDLLRARVFGASQVLTGLGGTNSVAQANANFVREFLDREGIRIETAQLGGDRGLLVEFETHTGRAWSSAIADQLDEVLQEERQLEAQLGSKAVPTGDNVTLF